MDVSHGKFNPITFQRVIGDRIIDPSHGGAILEEAFNVIILELGNFEFAGILHLN